MKFLMYFALLLGVLWLGVLLYLNIKYLPILFTSTDMVEIVRAGLILAVAWTASGKMVVKK